MRYFFRVEYDGAKFCGWQRQPHQISVQQRIEEALSTVLRTPIAVVGAGRTDTGVHARALGVHFDYAGEIDTMRFERSVNGVLDSAAAIFGCTPVEDSFHARFSAVSREYAYRIVLRKSPWWNERAWYCRPLVDWERVSDELGTLAGEYDFSTFCAAGSGAAHNRCTIETACLERVNEVLLVRLRANRFVYRMVRSLVGTLVDIGQGHIRSTLLDLIAAGDRCLAGRTAPAHGLTLENVYYRGGYAEQVK